MKKAIPSGFGRLQRLLSHLLLATLLLTTAKTSAQTALADMPFWQNSAGFWLSVNTYLGNDYQHKIESYHTLTEIRVEKQQVNITEYKFYPAGSFAGASIGITLDESKGVLLQQELIGKLSANSGDVIFGNEQDLASAILTRMHTIDNESALMTYTERASGKDLYRMFVTMPTPNSRIVVNLGIDTQNTDIISNRLRGVSVFSATRLAEAAVSVEQQMLAQLYQVGSIVIQDHTGRFTVTPINVSL